MTLRRRPPRNRIQRLGCNFMMKGQRAGSDRWLPRYFLFGLRLSSSSQFRSCTKSYSIPQHTERAGVGSTVQFANGESLPSIDLREWGVCTRPHAVQLWGCRIGVVGLVTTPSWRVDPRKWFFVVLSEKTKAFWGSAFHMLRSMINIIFFIIIFTLNFSAAFYYRNNFWPPSMNNTYWFCCSSAWNKFSY